jgi:hypothetical protein
LWRGVEEPVPSVAEGTPGAPILPTPFGLFRPPKPESRVHPFNNLFATSRRSVSVMTHIKFVASCLALPATADGSWTEVVILRPLWIRNVDFPKTIPALLKGCSTLLASPFHDRTEVPAKRISGKLLLPAPPGSGTLPEIPCDFTGNRAEGYFRGLFPFTAFEDLAFSVFWLWVRVRQPVAIHLRRSHSQVCLF